MPLYPLSEDYRIDVLDCDLVTGGADDVTFTIKPVTRAIFHRIRNAHTKKRANPETRQMVEVTDDAKAAEDLLDEALVGWSGVLDPDTNEPIPCERPYKLQLDAERGAKIIQLATKSQVTAGTEGRSKSFRRAT